MFGSNNLKTHLENSSTVEIQSLVYSEINMNDPDNILRIGNYRNRSSETITAAYVDETSATVNPRYYGYTDSDILVDGGYNENEIATPLASTQEKVNLYYSLEDCFRQFRPRSGINKASFYSRADTHYLHNYSPTMMSRPRYYISDKTDKFKYWSSFRYEVSGTAPNQKTVARGISTSLIAGGTEEQYKIDDVAPFIVYKEAVPINRVILKMQTHVGTSTDANATYYDYDGYSLDDPFYEVENEITNRVIPVDWKVQYLNSSNVWSDLKVFTSALDEDDNPIIGRDGYIELQLNSGTWEVASSSLSSSTPVLSDFTDIGLNGTEYLSVKGIRLVVNSLTRKDFPFELIELSGRLAIDLTDIVQEYSIKKVAANLGSTSIPVGQLIASTGRVSIADYDLAFSLDNPDSIIANRLQKNTQIKFYEIVKGVDTDGDVYIPIKTMYTDLFPIAEARTRKVELDLRDLFTYFESTTAPEIFVQNASFSYAVALLLDSIGFSNYIYKKSVNDVEPIIQDFFIEPNASVAQVLQDLAVSTQTAMFFDEYNNLVLMSKSYMLPGNGDRETDTENLVFYGSPDPAKPNALSNIIDIKSQEQDIYNAGKIIYVERYIQKTVREIRQASLLDSDRTWIYKPVVLWEVTATEQTKPENGELQNQSAYTLAAIPLHTNLSATVPYVDSSNVIRGNIMNLGEGIYWITRYNGYLYANGEIIKFDAVEYSIQGIGNRWVNSAEEYSEYFGQLAFNGKIFPTGRVRIYTEPYYNSDGTTPKVGIVAKHGRGQFNTPVVEHNAGLAATHWSRDVANVNGVTMDSSLLFDASANIPSTSNNSAGTVFGSSASLSTAKKSSRTGMIRNFLSSSYFAEDDPNSPQAKATATVQSSALVFAGPAIASSSSPRDFVSYVKKSGLSTLVGQKPNHVGTRIRLVGQTSSDSSTQLPSGSFSAGQYGDVKVSANSGGIAIMSAKENIGYFFEIAALSSLNMESYAPDDESLSNVMFYKTARKSSDNDAKGKAVPLLLWYGRSNILVDDGKFVGQYRMSTEENPTVYDLAIEYVETVQTRQTKGKLEQSVTGITFYLYLNNKLIGQVTDSNNPIKLSDSVALFVRGSTRAMFENIYALSNNKSANYYNSSETPLQSASTFSKEAVVEESFRRYAIPEAVSETYLTGISAIAPKKHGLWFEEFGTIMREMDYFNIKYDKAYPALAAYVAPTFNSTKGYAISGFVANAYGAEFLVFNISDKAISLDEQSGNWLRILGVTFTQQTNKDLTLDEYFIENGNLSDPAFLNGQATGNIVLNKENYQRIKNSIAKYGKQEFSVDAPYIQNKSIAENTMKFLIKNMTMPRKAVGLDAFGVPHLQLGDIVKFNYETDNIPVIADSTKRFVVYSIDHSRRSSGLKNTVYVSEVID